MPKNCQINIEISVYQRSHNTFRTLDNQLAKDVAVLARRDRISIEQYIVGLLEYTVRNSPNDFHE